MLKNIKDINITMYNAVSYDRKEAVEKWRKK